MKLTAIALRKGALVASCLATMASLTACDDLQQALGMERSQPDEGKVRTNPPLSLPPDYNLKPPRESSKEADPNSTENGGPTDPSLKH